MIDPERTLSLEETTAEVARLLSESGLAATQTDGRVSAVPDARTIRYYTTIGLLDRPLVEGRLARYGMRHVLQLIAIKALQAEGLPLAEVQARLYARSDRELSAIVGAAAAAARARPLEPQEIRAVAWREVAIEPGLKILAEEGWSPGVEPGALLERIRAALAALDGATTRPSGGGSSPRRGK